MPLSSWEAFRRRAVRARARMCRETNVIAGDCLKSNTAVSCDELISCERLGPLLAVLNRGENK